jgi:tetratricopeptide (TPR) repeat protein
MTRLLRTTAFLIATSIATTALAMGGTSTTTTAPKVVAPKKVVKKSPSKTPAPESTAIVDLWAAKWGDLGPAYLASVKLAQDGKYDQAISALNALNKPDDPRVLNWIGFSYRKMGKVDEAMPYYEKALAKAPEFTPAHEYMGEAYLQMKNVDKAKEQLAQIEKLCGNQTCEEYKDLSEAISKSAL